MTRQMPKTLLGIAVAAAAMIGFAASANATVLTLGESMSFTGYNQPGSCSDSICSDNVIFGVPDPLIDGGLLTLTTRQVIDGHEEWDVFSLTTNNGGPLAGDLNGDWSLSFYGVAGAGIYNTAVFQWTANGQPFSPLTNYGGMCCATATNPSPISGEAYEEFGNSKITPGYQDIAYWYEDPYSAVSYGGVDPNTANGFNFALGYQLASVSEPAALGIFGLGAMLIGMFAGLRRRFG